MRLGILSSVWGRPELTELFLDRIEHLKKKYDIVPVIVGTDYEFAQECIVRNIPYLDYANKPLGAKWNAGISLFEDLDVSHVMILGSDDFVSDAFVEHVIKFNEGKDFTGCKDVYMFGANPKRKGWQQLFYFRYKGYLVGPGRCLSKRILKMMDYSPWAPQRNYGLDGSVVKNIKRLGSHVVRGSFVMKDEGLFMVDIKTIGNISGIPGGAKPVDDDFIKMLMFHLSWDEAGNISDHLIKTGAIVI